jgi:hypothetical protein
MEELEFEVIGVCLRDHDECFVKANTLCIVAHLTVKDDNVEFMEELEFEVMG